MNIIFRFLEYFESFRERESATKKNVVNFIE